MFPLRPHSTLVLYLVSWAFCLPKNDILRINKFAEYHCKKLKECSYGSDPVCGINKKHKFVAQFPDKCTFHGVNCYQQGVFREHNVDFDSCKADIIFGDQVSNEDGLYVNMYYTYLPNFINVNGSRPWTVTRPSSFRPNITGPPNITDAPNITDFTTDLVERQQSEGNGVLVYSFVKRFFNFLLN